MKNDIREWLEEADGKERILKLLLPALKEADGLRNLESLEYIPERETAVARFAGGQEITINVAGDSDIAMIYDVVVKLWRPY